MEVISSETSSTAISEKFPSNAAMSDDQYNKQDTSVTNQNIRKMNSMVLYFKLFGVYPATSWSKYQFWANILYLWNILFILLFSYFVVVDIIYAPFGIWWFVYFVTVVKASFVHYSMRNLRPRIKALSLNLTDEAANEELWEKSLNLSKIFYIVSSIVQFISLVLVAVVVQISIIGKLIVLFVYIPGVIGLTGYFAAVLHFSVFDAFRAKKSVMDLIERAHNQTISFEQFRKIREEIKEVSDNYYFTNGILIFAIILNFAAGVVTASNISYFSRYTTSTLLAGFINLSAVISALWLSELLFLRFLLPAIAEINDEAIKLRSMLANKVFISAENEKDRHMILLSMIAGNIQFTIVGLAVSERRIKNGLITILVSMIGIVIRTLINLIIDEI